MSKPPTAPPLTVIPTDNSVKPSVKSSVEASVKGNEPTLTRGEKHVRVLVVDLYRSGMSQETIESVTGVPRGDAKDWVKKVVVDGRIRPKVAGIYEHVSPKIEHSGKPGNGEKRAQAKVQVTMVETSLCLRRRLPGRH